MRSPFVRALVATALASSVSVTTASSYKAATSYANTWCQVPATAFDLTPVTTTTSCSASACAVTTSLGLKTRDATCGISDVDAYATSIFGANVPYVLQRVFVDDACTSEVRLLGRRMVDGDCFRDSATASHRFAVRVDGAVEQRLFSTSDCTGGIASIVEVAKSDAGAEVGPCTSRTTWSVRNAAFASLPRYRMETYYAETTCQNRNRLVFTPIENFAETVAPVSCGRKGGLAYSTTSETTVDPDTAAYTTYGASNAYVLRTDFFDTNCTAILRVNGVPRRHLH